MGCRVLHKLTLVLFISLWIVVQMNITVDVQKTRKKLTCLADFEMKIKQCTSGFLDLHHQLGLFSNNRNNRINIIYISIHKDIYCKRYIASLQCIHEALTNCSRDTTTSIVQHRLSQVWALTANKICNINDKTAANESRQKLPTQITDLLQKSSYQFLEPDRLGPNDPNNNLYQNTISETERGSLDINSEPPTVSTAQNEKLNTSENSIDKTLGQSGKIADGKLTFLMGQSFRLLKRLGNMFSLSAKNMSGSFKNSKKDGVKGITDPSDITPEIIQVKFETVILERLRIINNRESTKWRFSNVYKNVKNSKDISADTKPQSSVVKEFEMSNENRDSSYKKTNITTFKWKTKLRGVM